MNLPFKLKSWLSLEDAASYLSKAFVETITVDGLLRIVLDGQLPLSWNVLDEFAHPVTQFCTLANDSDKHWHGSPAQRAGGEESVAYENEVYWADNWAYRRAKGSEDGTIWAYLDWIPDAKDAHDIKLVSGLFRFDLELNNTRSWVQGLLNGISESPRREMCVLDCRGDIWSFVDTRNDGRTFEERRRMPPFEELVIQRADLEAFESQLAGSKSEPADRPGVEPVAQPPKESARERNTLLRIIGLMANHRYGGDIEKPYTIASHLTEKAKDFNIDISDQTIANHIKAAIELLKADKT